MPEFTCSPLWHSVGQLFSRRQRILPSSCTTPVNTCPRHQTPVVSHTLAITCMRLLLSSSCKLSAFGCYTLSSRTTTIPISGLNPAAYILESPSSAPSLREITWVLLPAWWLTISWVGFDKGNLSHPLGSNIEFQRTVTL